MSTSIPDSEADSPPEVTRLRDLSSQQWKSGLAAWLGWLFDGLDLHLYTVVAVTIVTELLGPEATSADVGRKAGWIQAAFLIGWALGGGFFGIVGDRIGRSKALMLTILTYAMFTGISYFAQTWWHLLIFRFLAALGIGGEWAVGASLLSETWPKTWRPWMAAVLQTAVNIGILLAGLTVYLMAGLPPRTVFLVGVLPALLVLWIRRAVPEPEEWHAARKLSSDSPRFADLFRGELKRTTWLTICVCALGLTGHWGFMFWLAQSLRNLAEVKGISDPAQAKVFANQIVGQATMALMLASIAGNFVAAVIAKNLGYRRAISSMCLCYFLTVTATFTMAKTYGEIWYGLLGIGICQGVFCLFTMYLPALFPTLLRTTGAGFCYNIGRIAAGVGTVVFGWIVQVENFQLALICAASLFLPAAVIGMFLPEPQDDSEVK